MRNPLTREQNNAVKTVAKYLICCGIAPKLAGEIARAEVLAGIVKPVNA